MQFATLCIDLESLMLCEARTERQTLNDLFPMRDINKHSRRITKPQKQKQKPKLVFRRKCTKERA